METTNVLYAVLAMNWNKFIRFFTTTGFVAILCLTLMGASWGAEKSPAPETTTVAVERQYIDVEVTAYTEAEDECGKPIGHPAYGITASGEKVRRGIIAVDTSVIPMHSKVVVEGLGKWSGEYVAKDTGGAIVGNRIDIYVPTKQEAFELGRRKAKLYIVGDGR